MAGLKRFEDRHAAWKRWRTVLAAAACALALSPAQRADACSMIASWPFSIDPVQQLADTVPPDAIGQVGVSVARGTAPRCNGNTCTSTSCDGIGSVLLEFAGLHDDQTPVERMGIALELVQGEAPAGLMPTMTLGAGPDARIVLNWGDGATPGQEPIDFMIVARAVDAAGNVGPATEPVRIHHDGITAEQASGASAGCSALPGAGERGASRLALSLVWFAAIAWLTRSNALAYK
jgi:hypothetical protein